LQNTSTHTYVIINQQANQSINQSDKDKMQKWISTYSDHMTILTTSKDWKKWH